MSDETERTKKKALLQSYYSGQAPAPPSSSLKDPYDIDSLSFEPDLYLRRLIRDRDLCEIMDIEHDVVKETRILDSEMQTLVSENYNKFISATDTIRKMRSDFKKMEEEMESLVVGMGEITESNESVNCTFKDRREQITRLNNVDHLLKKLQFLFELPARLAEFLAQEAYALAVKYYCKARRTLDHYKQMPTFRSIEDECTALVNDLKARLYERLDGGAAQQVTAESVDLLSKLGEPMQVLCAKFVARAQRGFDDDLAILALNTQMLGGRRDGPEIAMDILEFVDYGCNYFLANLGGVIRVFSAIFVQGGEGEAASEQLSALVSAYWLKYCDIVKRRFEVEVGEFPFVFRALLA